MAAGTLASRITGVFRDIALVAAIGTGVFSDTYSVANSIPNIIYILIAGGAINAVFIPALVRHMEDDEDQGKQFTDVRKVDKESRLESGLRQRILNGL